MAVLSRPSITTLPLSGGSSPPNRWSNVLLPQPEGPMMATSSPRRTVRLTPSTATWGRTEMWKVLPSPSAASSGSAVPVAPVTSVLVPLGSGVFPPRPPAICSDIEEKPQHLVDDALKHPLLVHLPIGPGNLVGGPNHPGGAGAGLGRRRHRRRHGPCGWSAAGWRNRRRGGVAI